MNKFVKIASLLIKNTDTRIANIEKACRACYQNHIETITVLMGKNIKHDVDIRWVVKKKSNNGNGNGGYIN